MSDGADPAIGVLEYESVAAGLVAGDAMVKASPVGSVYAGTVHPGKYMVLVSGDTASVEVAMAAGRLAAGQDPVDEAFIPDVHSELTRIVTADVDYATLEGVALGIVEGASVASVLEAADAGLKAARVDLAAAPLADGLGGKSYLLFSGAVSEVEAAVAAASARMEGQLVRADVIAQFHEEMAANLRTDLTWRRRLRRRSSERRG